MSPLDIFQQALDAVTRAFRAADFDAYMALLDLPYLVQTRTATHLITSAEQMRPTFDALAQGLKARGISHYERVARSADYVARDRIEGWHHSHLIADGEPLAYPHLSRHALVRRGGRWLFSEAQYDMIEAADWPLTASDFMGHLDALTPQIAQ
jgi:hypothetical protein